MKNIAQFFALNQIQEAQNNYQSPASEKSTTTP